MANVLLYASQAGEVAFGDDADAEGTHANRRGSILTGAEEFGLRPLRSLPVSFLLPSWTRKASMTLPAALAASTSASGVPPKAIRPPAPMGAALRAAAGFEIESRDLTKTKRDAILAGKSLNMR
jgi:hypothetical protein